MCMVSIIVTACDASGVTWISPLLIIKAYSDLCIPSTLDQRHAYMYFLETKEFWGKWTSITLIRTYVI